MQRFLLLAVVALLATAGCIGSGGPVTDGEPSTASASPTQTPESTPSSTPSPTPPPTSAAGDDTIRYEELNADQRAAFDAAREGEVTFAPDSPHVEARFHAQDVGPFYEYDYVRWNGTDYRISLTSGRLYAQYGIEATRTDGTEGLTVVALENLTADVRDEVRAAVEDGSHTVPYGKWDSLPEELQTVDAVREGDEVYALTYVVGDYWADVLTVEPVDGS